MFGDGGLRPPVHFYPIIPPPMVSGAPCVQESTERGRTFLLTVVNLLHGSIKVFGDEEEISFDRSAWPGLELDAPQNEFQSISYIGESREKAKDWGDLFRADFDGDGTTDPGRRIDDGVPFSLYKERTNGDPAVDYGPAWNTVKEELSSDNSFWQAIQDRSYPTTDQGKFAFAVGLLQTKRSLIYGMTGIGIDPIHPNSADAISNFENIFNSWKIQEAGALNILVLQNYLGGLRTVAAERFNTIAGNDWLNNAALSGARRYFASRVSGVDLRAVRSDIDSFKAALANLKSLIGADGRLASPDNSSRAGSSVAQIRSALSNLPDRLEAVNRNLGLVPGDLMTYEKDFDELTADWEGLAPSRIDGETNFGALISRLNDIETSLDSVNSTFGSMLANPSSVVDGLFGEIRQPLSTEPLAEDFQTAIAANFSIAARGPLGFVIGAQAASGVFRVLNKTNRAVFEGRKEERRMEEIEEMKGEMKHESIRKAEENGALKKADAQKQNLKNSEANKLKNKNTVRKGR
jgi:hypothetical protein